MLKKLSYTLSNQAAEDLSEIARYTVQQFGAHQTKKYGQELESSFEQLAVFPFMGTSAEALFPNLRRFEFRPQLLFVNPYEF